MHEIAMKYGFDDIMEHTWFCPSSEERRFSVRTVQPMQIHAKRGAGKKGSKTDRFSIRGILLQTRFEKTQRSLWQRLILGFVERS
jgi:hypothetical protein